GGVGSSIALLVRCGAAPPAPIPWQRRLAVGCLARSQVGTCCRWRTTGPGLCSPVSPGCSCCVSPGALCLEVQVNSCAQLIVSLEQSVAAFGGDSYNKKVVCAG
ncbi:unnamed protein product, partial [Heterosigma akashiwo]